MKPHRFVLLVILSLVIVSGISAQSTKRKGPIVRQVDRILIESGNPKALFDFLSATLQLPEAWPLAENQGYVSGGLGIGNVNLEIYQYAHQKGATIGKSAEAHFVGLALEPYPLSDALRELQASGIPYNHPEPYVSTLPNGSPGAMWTTVPLPSFSKSGMSIFLYEYSPTFLNVDIRRKQLGNRLTLNNGGPLGIQSLREIVIAVANFEKTTRAWKRLLGEPVSPGNWSVGAGPSIRLVQGSEERIQKIVIQLKSHDRAKIFLRDKELLGAVSAKEMSLNPSKVQGLSISLVE